MVEELEITITPAGEVKIHVKGVKGKKCLKSVEMVRQMLGNPDTTSQQLTGEYYEPDPEVRISPTQHQSSSQ